MKRIISALTAVLMLITASNIVALADNAATGIDYDGFEIHIAGDDSYNDQTHKIVWKSQGTSTWDNAAVSNNRFIKFTPSENGEISVTFQADGEGSTASSGKHNYACLYIVEGSDTSCMSKTNSAANGTQAEATAINTDTELKANVIAGRTYYIWAFAYLYKETRDIQFTVTDISFEAKAVNEIQTVAVNYKSGSGTIAEKTVNIGTGHYSGDSYAYTSTAYIKGDDNKIYAVCADEYTNYTQSYAAADANNGGANKEIRNTVTLAENTVIEYNVKETDIIFYDEFENLLDGGTASFDDGRYWSSGGTMAAISGTKEFYPVTSAGYYTVTFMGAGNNNGTEIFKNKAEADAATAFGTSVLGIKYNNQYYGLYSSYTIYLNTTDNLTIKNYGGTDKVDFVIVRPVNAGDIAAVINGAGGVTAGNTSQMELVTDLKETPVWTVSGVNGVEIDQNGLLTAAANAGSGTVTVTVSFNGGAKTVTKNVQIGALEIGGVDFDGTTAVNIGAEKQYKVKAVQDQFGNDISDYTVEYSSSAPSVIEINPSTGAAKANAKGTAEISATVTVGTASKTFKKTVKADNYSIIADADGSVTEVDISDIVQSDNITGYTVTTADEDGNKVLQYSINKPDGSTSEQIVASEDAVVIYASYNNGVLEKAEILDNVKAGTPVSERAGTKMLVWNSLSSMKPVTLEKHQVKANTVTVNTTGAARVEISPVYTYTYDATTDEARADKMLLSDSFADGDYGFEITKAPVDQYHAIYDLYINGAMIGNNVNEKGIGREFTANDLTYSVRDITVDGGSIELEKEEFYSLSKTPTLRTPVENRGVSKIVVTKEATIANRNQKVYILGDSLVAIYYGEPTGGYTTDGLVGTARTGWGQLIHNFINDEVDVLDLANSGQWASGLQKTAFTCVMQSARAGDYMILESGWNDVSYSTKAEMKQAIIEMTEACEEKGIIPVLVTPNSSAQTFSAGENTQYAAVMREAAAEMKAKYSDVIFVDLAKLSYEFLRDTYSSDTDVMTRNINLGYAGTSSVTGEKGDMLHLSYLGAMKYAEIVAQSMSDQGVPFINKDFSWSITDKAGNEISMQVK